MRKIIAALNMTLDGFCDHNLMIADEELHEHFENMIVKSDLLLYGRTTFELMKYWKELARNPSGDASMDGFAKAMDQTPKLVFSTSMKDPDWESARMATSGLAETVRTLKQNTGNGILVGSRSLIVQLTQLKLVDEFQICLHPVLAGKGLPLFQGISELTYLKLTKTKQFGTGTLCLFYDAMYD